MKKIFVIILLLFTAEIYSQYSLTIYLQTSGVPVTGKAGTMVFTRYPHSYGTDNVSGLTISEVGATGSYIAKGFTTYEYVKLWVDGTAQTWFDSVQVGDITAYITTRLGSYVTLGTSQAITGSKTFSGSSIFGDGTVSGNWTQSLGTFTLYGPKINTSATIYSAYGSVSADNLIWLGIGDSLYGRKPYFLDGSNIRLNTGYKLYGRTNMTAPINVNTSHFSYSGDMLSLLNPFTTDSLTIKKDTTISEATYSKLWTWKRRYFSQRDSMDSYIYYKNTYTNTSDSFAVINKIYDLIDGRSVSYDIGTSGTNIDTIYLPQPGTYQVIINYEYEFEYLTPTNSVYDSLKVTVYNGEPSEDDRVEYATHKFTYTNTVPSGFQGTGTLTFTWKATNSNIGTGLFLAGTSSKTVTKSVSAPYVFVKTFRVHATRIN